MDSRQQQNSRKELNMSFSINTNVASLQAENYLSQTSNFQNQTINEVTSGLRIVNSGDDAAGLAIANGDRSTEAVLTQGIQNATNGQNELQTADSGMTSIGNLLDTARSLATESASGTFTGDRSVLNTEFQSVLTEINRQAQAIGLNQGGSLATNVSVFIGGGQSSNGINATTNGSVGINLSQATVDAKSLGLEGVQATGAAGTDIGGGSNTSVANILANASNQASITNNTTDFTFTGPGFSNTTGGNTITVAVNLNGVTDTGTLVTAINAAIAAAGNGNSQQATAFKNANITAAINTNANGQQQLSFNSANSAFQVQGGDQVATALLGNFSSGSTGNVANVNATAAQSFAAPAAAETVQLQITGAGLTGTQGDFNVALTTADTGATAVSKLNAAIAANTALAATGIQASLSSTGAVQFTGKTGLSFQVSTAGDVSNALGFGSYMNSLGQAGGNTGNFNYTSLTAGNAIASSATQGIQISLNGGATIDLGVLTGGATELAQLTSLNQAFSANKALSAAGITAVDAGGFVKIESQTGTDFRLNTYGGTGDAFGFGATPATVNVASSSDAVSTATATSAGTQNISVTLANGTTVNLGTLTASGTQATDIATLNAAFTANASTLGTSGANLVAAASGNGISITSTAGANATVQNFTLNLGAGSVTNAFGFGGAAGVQNGKAAGAVASAYTALNSIDSAGAQQAQDATGNGVFQFTGLTNAGDAQTITLTAVDANGTQHSLNVNLNTTNASTLDQAVNTINSAIAASNDSTLEQIGAFKQEGTANNTAGVEGVSFNSAGGPFKVSLGASPASSASTTANPQDVGITDAKTGLSGGAVFSSVANGTGATADISNIATATAAVSALANSVAILGTAQAAVGNGENSLNYAINLASSQLTNLAASESAIRDANMATESANLTKSQIQLQAGIAALSQANSAPQQILTLLQH
jgi:flagellin